MDYRCPLCAADLGVRKLSQPIIARLEIECPFCKRRIRVNFHRAEVAIILGSFAALVGFFAAAYWLERDGLLVAAFAAALAGAAALPLAERLWLRTWPRYVAPAAPAVGDLDDER